MAVECVCVCGLRARWHEGEHEDGAEKKLLIR